MICDLYLGVAARTIAYVCPSQRYSLHVAGTLISQPTNQQHLFLRITRTKLATELPLPNLALLASAKHESVCTTVLVCLLQRQVFRSFVRVLIIPHAMQSLVSPLPPAPVFPISIVYYTRRRKSFRDVEAVCLTHVCYTLGGGVLARELCPRYCASRTGESSRTSHRFPSSASVYETHVWQAAML